MKKLSWWCFWVSMLVLSHPVWGQENPFDAMEEKMDFFMDFIHGYFSRMVIIVAIIAIGTHWMFTKKLHLKEDGMILIGAIVIAIAGKIARWLLGG